MLTVFSEKVTCLVDVGQAVDIVYLDFSKAFAMVSNSLLLKKLMCHSVDKWSMQQVRNWLTSPSLTGSGDK